MKPPKCRNCGGEEWRHICSGSVSSPAPSRVTSQVVAAKPAVNKKVVVDTASGGTGAVVDMANARTRDRHKKTAARREYLRRKQRESRARRAVWRVSGAAT